jgi:3-dehydroquinate synthase
MRRSFTFGGSTCTVSVVSRADLYRDVDPNAFCIADANTSRYLPDFGIHHTLPAGEAAKSWSELERILGRMLDAELTRGSLVVGTGGGVVSDIAALAASLYMRGCRLTLVPTTLLAMVDAAVGGKTGVNFGGYKNMVGTFYPADHVLIAPQTLETLSEREYRSGLAEVIKTAMLGDDGLLAMLEDEQESVLGRDPELLSEIVWTCVGVKGEIVEADLTESGVRAHLNLGHTFAHALESVQGLGLWSHGEAVAWGLARALELGAVAGMTDPAWVERVMAILSRYGYRTEPIPEATGEIIGAMRRDKKRLGREIRFVLQKGPGETIVSGIDTSLVEAVLNGTA